MFGFVCLVWCLAEVFLRVVPCCFVLGSLLLGCVFNVQRFSVEDGPGIRTTVFLKGCGLRCRWCQNPESWSLEPVLVWHADRCIGARRCLGVCPSGVLALEEEGMRVLRGRCDGCGECVQVCSAGAVELIGVERSVEDVTEEVLRDRVFFEESGGGVTLSGGDPLFQPMFAGALMTSFRDNGLHVALDTAGYSGLEEFRALVELADLVLLDLKLMDSVEHLAATGVPVEPVLRNARWLGTQSKRVWVRTPIIPGFTDSTRNISAIARFIREGLPSVERWDLLGFNNVCVAKWERLGMDFVCADTPLVSGVRMARLVKVARASQVPQIKWSGVECKSSAS